MKKSILVFFILSTCLFAQLRAPMNEIFIGTENVTGDVPTFTLTAVSQIWDTEIPRATNPIVLTNAFQTATYEPSANNQAIGSWAGFDFCYSGGDFGFGRYKLSTGSDYIYLDYRDDRFGLYDPQSVPSESAQDIWIKYKWDSHTSDYIFYWSTSANNPSWNTGDMNIWTAKDQGSPTTGKFEPGVPDNFDIDLKEESWPILEWNHSSEADYIVGYKIYRAITDLYNDPRTFSLLETVSSSSTSFADTEVEFGGWDYAWYYIVSKNTSIDSDPTDELGAPLISLQKDGTWEIIENDQGINIASYELENNYPNPFNPTTKINFQIQKSGHVSLKVYDMLGKEVANLIDGVKEAGKYSIDFDASNLSSGTYFYYLKAGEYSESKKMVLTK